jgi:proton-dependent oligopeptide transporter, POT family
MLNTEAGAAPRAEGPSLFGHPKGLYFLAFTETWERFSYYGMTALVVLYMVNQLLLPGHVEHIVGFAQLRSGMESLSGPLSPQALASQLFGLYAGMVYFTPLLGGMLADRWIGQRNAVVIGALSMFAGHIAMAFDESFLLALLLLVLGSGLLKGNISAQVGALYPRDDEARRSRGFVIFSTGINIGAVLGPLVCGALALYFGWHTGFGVAAVFMLAGLITYLTGYKYLPARVARTVEQQQQPLTAADWRVIGALIAVIVISILPSLAYTQHFNVMPVWIQQHVALDVGSWHIPVPWFQSIDSLTSTLSAAPLLWLWRRQAARGGGPGDIDKIAIGSWIGAGSNLMLAGAIYAAGGQLLHPIWPFLYCIGLGLTFIYYWPAMLALVSRAAPARVNSTMVGLVFVNLFVTNLLVGWIGGRYERMSPMNFWSLHAAMGVAGGLVLMAFGRGLTRALSSPSANKS